MAILSLSHSSSGAFVEDSQSCLDPAGPLLSVSNDRNSWALPNQASSPNDLSSARFELHWIFISAIGHWQANLLFTFGSPPDYGIPFSFQVIKFTDSHSSRDSLIVDWSNQCHSPGRSLFPGQSFSDVIDFTEYTDPVHSPADLISIWGRRE